jgi:nicotinamidase-related amidase
MATVTYEKQITALLVIDPYNDFISEGGQGSRPEFEPKPGEVVATEHWCSSGFANTDLDLQLKKHGISAHRHRPHRPYLHRSDRSLCC